MVGIENFVVDGGLVRIMLAGTFANRPAFGTVGRIYVATDTGAFYYDTGSAWVSLGSSGATPNLQQVINAGGTVTDSSGAPYVLTTIYAAAGLNITGGIPHAFGSYCVVQSDIIKGGNAVTSSIDWQIDNNGGSAQFGQVSIKGGTPKQSLQADGSLLTLQSGTYTPNLSPTNNCASVSLINAVYTQIGNVVNTTIVMSVTPTLAALNTGVQAINMPVTFTSYNSFMAQGVAIDNVTDTVVPVSTTSPGSTVNIIIVFQPSSNRLHYVTINIQYSGTP